MLPIDITSRYSPSVASRLVSLMIPSADPGRTGSSGSGVLAAAARLVMLVLGRAMARLLRDVGSRRSALSRDV